jgi:NADH:ubiquinone oxidoreductase subunit E
MGSSCFARGNARILQQLETFIENHERTDIQLVGHLCMGECSQGPNIRIDGQLIQPDEREMITTMIEEKLMGKQR